MRAPAVLLVLCALLATLPHAEAGLFSRDPVTVTVGEARVGDRLRYDVSQSGPVDASASARTNSTLVVLVEPTGQTRDRFGILREVDRIRVDGFDEDGLAFSERCHELSGGLDQVARETLFSRDGMGSGYSARWGLGGALGETTVTGESTKVMTYGANACFGRTGLDGARLREGDRMPATRMFPEAPENLTSEPALAASFHDRPALQFPFRVELGPDAAAWMNVTFADGLPGLALMTFEGDPEDPDSGARLAMTGFEAGSGPALRPFAGLRLPEENPEGGFRGFDRLGLDDTAFGLRYPFREAWENVLRDPTMPLAAFLASHPRAHLSFASYRSEGGQMRSEGEWTFLVTEGRDGVFLTTERFALPEPASKLAVKPVQNAKHAAPPEDAPVLREAPPRVADSATLARVAALGGVAPADVVVLSYYVGVGPEGRADPALFVGDASCCGGGAETSTKKGRSILLDVRSGGLQMVSENEMRTETTGLLAPGARELGSPAKDPSALSALAGPVPGAGLAGGAAVTGIALLLVLLKFVAVPLFTRLRKAKLLDNPVRARLY